MAPRDGVKVGGVRPMDAGQASSEEEERQKRVENIVRGAGGSALSDPFGLGWYFDKIRQGLESNRQAAQAAPELTAAEKLAQQRAFQSAGRQAQNVAYQNRLAQTGSYYPQEPDTTTRGDVLNEIMAEFGLLSGEGGGAVRPDYSAYRTALTDQAQQLNAQIQAMYNALGEEAGANVERIQDIYGGASAGIGDVYGSATENITQAYESAQQQAADQMARLGIEAAAPQILPTQALSQAEAVAGLEAGRAGGLSAAERYGASGAQFGSEMAQVAQQQGTEMNAAILASLQNRLAESLAAEQAGVSGGGGGGRGMSVSDMLRLQEYADEVYRRDVLGEIPLEEREAAMDAARIAQEFESERSWRVAQIMNDVLGGRLSDASPEQVAAAREYAESIIR